MELLLYRNFEKRLYSLLSIPAGLVSIRSNSKISFIQFLIKMNYAMKKLFIMLALLTLSASYFSSCSEDEIVTPTEEGGSTQESTRQWD